MLLLWRLTPLTFEAGTARLVSQPGFAFGATGPCWTAGWRRWRQRFSHQIRQAGNSDLLVTAERALILDCNAERALLQTKCRGQASAYVRLQTGQTVETNCQLGTRRCFVSAVNSNANLSAAWPVVDESGSPTAAGLTIPLPQH